MCMRQRQRPPPRQYKACIPSVWKILRRLFFFEGTLFKEGAWSPTFPHTNHPQGPEARHGKFVVSVGSGNQATSVYPQRGAFSPQDKTVPGLCPRVAAEGSAGNNSVEKTRKAGKVRSRKGGNELTRNDTRSERERKGKCSVQIYMTSEVIFHLALYMDLQIT